MKKVRIAAASGFWGDWLEAPIKQIQGGPIDYLVMDYLAELTMSILSAQYKKDHTKGYAADFVDLVEKIHKDLKQKKIKLIANAGGISPENCALAIRERVPDLDLKIAIIEGDNFLENLPNLIKQKVSLDNLDNKDKIDSIQSKVQSANAYIGVEKVLDALDANADIIITGRVADASLFLAPLVHELGWNLDDWNSLALGTAAGHILECGAQSSGGNCSYDWQSINDLANIGFPIIEANENSELYICKHDNTGGRIDLRTIKEQIVYEISDPKNYITPDVIADFSSIRLEESGKDRVKISRVRGKPKTNFYKASISYTDGYKAEDTLVYTWPDAYQKAQLADKIIRERISKLGLEEILTEFIGANACHGFLEEKEEPALSEVMLRIATRSNNSSTVAKFTRELIPLVLGGPPFATGYAKGKPKVQKIYSYWPALIEKQYINPRMRVI